MRKLFSSIAVAAVFLSANPAGAHHGTPAYSTYYFTDATLTNQVGYTYFIGCDYYDNPQFELDGQNTMFSTSGHLMGYCSDGFMEPL